MARIAIALIVLAALAAAVAVAMRLARAAQARAAPSAATQPGLPAPQHPARKLAFVLLMGLILYVSVYGGQAAAVSGGAG
ncbi:MAG: hypothetical protein ACU0AT_10620 [Tranquillimonas sp.]